MAQDISEDRKHLQEVRFHALEACRKAITCYLEMLFEGSADHVSEQLHL